MKTNFFTRSMCLIFSISVLFSGYAFSGETERNFSAPVYLELQNNGTIKEGTDIRFTIQFDRSANAAYSVEQVTDQPNVRATLSTGRAKDGKVDVDIIIFAGAIKPFLRPYSVNKVIKLHLFTMQFITVDNISGVFQGHSGPGSGRIINFGLSEDGNASAPGSEQQQEESVIVAASGLSIPTLTYTPVAPVKATPETQVNLYPNPVRDGSLNVSFGTEASQVSSVQVFNSLGALISQFKPEGDSPTAIQISVDNLSNGVYFLKLKTANGELVRKFNVAR